MRDGVLMAWGLTVRASGDFGLLSLGGMARLDRSRESYYCVSCVGAPRKCGTGWES